MVGLAQNQLVLVIVSSSPIDSVIFLISPTFKATNAILLSFLRIVDAIAEWIVPSILILNVLNITQPKVNQINAKALLE
ncbi:MAG: hypothetical protein KME54_00495 [Tolypothrix brevis GSE-NOS-MK-07-07A]|nr:hypothetical protein [Tolypothrix brevis GSE-NOS-MK-07-07A]